MAGRLPRADASPTRPRIRKYLASLGVKSTQYSAWWCGVRVVRRGKPKEGYNHAHSGKDKLMCFFQLNPDWSLKEWAMLVKENLAVIKNEM